MGKNLGRRIKKNSEELYRLYQVWEFYTKEKY
jgi:hypothetical protein